MCIRDSTIAAVPSTKQRLQIQCVHEIKGILKSLLTNTTDLVQRLLCLSEALQPNHRQGEPLERIGHNGVVGWHQPTSDSEGTLMQRDGVGEFAASRRQRAEVIQ